MKAYVISLAVGLLVGVIYSLLHVRSPAPPSIALVGLLGILLGEQLLPLGQQWWHDRVRPNKTALTRPAAMPTPSASPAPPVPAPSATASTAGATPVPAPQTPPSAPPDS